MIARVAWGKVKPGTWQQYEQLYRDEILEKVKKEAGDKARLLFVDKYLERVGRPNQLGDSTIALVYGVGGRWSEHVKPIVGSEWCEFHHAMYVLTGRMRVLMRDGEKREASAQLAAELERGTPLGEAFDKHRAKFPPLYGRLIEAGVRANNLPGVLLNLGRQKVDRYEMNHWSVPYAPTPPYVLAMTADHGQTPYPSETGGWNIIMAETAKDIDAEFDKVTPDKPESDDADLQKIVFHANRPGAETERAALARVMVSRLKEAKPAVQVLLLRHIQWFGREETRPAVAALLNSADLRVRECARPDFAGVVKEVKGNLKAPLADKQPIYALRFRRIGRVGETFVVEDSTGERLTMTDAGMTEEPPSCHLLQLLSPKLHEDQTLVVRFRHDLDRRHAGVMHRADSRAHDDGSGREAREIADVD